MSPHGGHTYKNPEGVCLEMELSPHGSHTHTNIEGIFIKADNLTALRA